MSETAIQIQNSCYICLESEGLLMKFCNCQGDMGYCHKKCIRDYVRVTKKDCCSLCKSPLVLQARCSKNTAGWWGTLINITYAGFVGLNCLISKDHELVDLLFLSLYPVMIIVYCIAFRVGALINDVYDE